LAYAKESTLTFQAYLDTIKAKTGKTQKTIEAAASRILRLASHPRKSTPPPKAWICQRF
jgi:hypothetical protein